MKHFSLSKAVFMAASLALLGLTAANAQEKFFPVIVIHGGTSGLDLTKEEFKIREEPMKKALLAGQAVLEKGGSAMDAVTAAIMVLEDDPNFNAGKGAVFTADGFNELDASIMDGSTKKAGAVAMDKNGNLAAATSTGGTTNKMTDRIGSYQRDSDKELDLAISKKEFIDNFLKQDAEEGFGFEQNARAAKWDKLASNLQKDKNEKNFSDATFRLA